MDLFDCGDLIRLFLILDFSKIKGGVTPCLKS